MKSGPGGDLFSILFLNVPTNSFQEEEFDEQYFDNSPESKLNDFYQKPSCLLW